MSATAPLLGTVTAVSVFVLMPWRHRRPARLSNLSPRDLDARRPGWADRIRQVPGFLGGLVCRRFRRPCEVGFEHRIGLTVLAVVPGILIHPLVGLCAVAVIWASPVVRRRRETRRRHDEVRDQLPEVVDMLRLAVAAGLTVRLAIDAVVGRCEGVIADQLREVRHRVLLGQRLHEALEALTELGEPLVPLTRALIASEADGAPLAPSLEQVASETRLLRRRAGEEAARRLPVKLLFPLVACILPAFILLTVVPLLGGAIGSLGL